MRHGLIAASLLGMLLLLVSCNSDDGGDTPTDTAEPQVAILQPADDAAVLIGNVLIQAQATDNEEVEKVEFYVDGIKRGEDLTGVSSVYEYTWNASSLAAGTSHNLKARAIDTSGNDDEATITVTMCPAGASVHSENITGAETWHACQNPHTVTQDIAVWEGGSLTIEPGCIVKFDAGASIGCGWTPSGEIVAIGTADSTILFTSNDPTPAPGDWEGIAFFNGTETTTRFSYCTVEYAGLADGQAIYLAWGGVLKMDHSTIRHSAGRGIYYEHAGHVEQFNNNTITDCANYPLALDPEYVRHLGTGNNYTGNDAGYDAIEVYYGGVETSGTWLDQGVPYRITEASNVWVGTTETPIILTIQAGTTIEFEANAEMTIGNVVMAGIVAEGTSTDPITFTSAAENPQPGDWRQLWIAGQSIAAQCRLSHCVFEYGGGGGGGNLWISSVVPLIEDCSFGYSSAYGIYLEGAEHPDPTTLEAENSFYSNASGDVYLAE